jgi:uracil-DNA glycosylase family protein
MMADSASPFVPDGSGIGRLRAAVQDCRGCPLWRDTTQAVFSRGRTTAAVVLVGEQPGDIEDREGEPFVGPAGRLLDRALAEVGIEPADTYLTNAVKHFKHEVRGKRRIHQRPQRTEIVACRPWLLAEFRAVRPRIVVALGATAASALLGPRFRVTRSRGELLPWPGASDRPEDFPEAPDGRILATVHPSAILRAPDRDEAYHDFVADLSVVASGLP